MKRCIKCGNELVKSESEDYSYSCNNCEEDFFEFEVSEQFDSYIWEVEFAWTPKRTFNNKWLWLIPYVKVSTSDGFELIDTFKRRPAEEVAEDAICELENALIGRKKYEPYI